MSNPGGIEEYRKNTDSSILEACMSTIESMRPEERRLAYRECAKSLLIRRLIEEKLVEGPLDADECIPFPSECVAENADGICFLFYVRGSVWDVILSRGEVGMRAIQEDPSRLEDPELFVMDLGKVAKVNPRDADFCA